MVLLHVPVGAVVPEVEAWYITTVPLTPFPAFPLVPFVPILATEYIVLLELSVYVISVLLHK